MELSEEQLRKVTEGGAGSAAFLSADHAYASLYWCEGRSAFWEDVMQSDLWVIGKRHYLSPYINAVQEREKTVSDDKAIDPKTASADDLPKTTAKGNMELTEEELVNVAGGVQKAGGTQLEYIKIKLDDVQVSS